VNIQLVDELESTFSYIPPLGPVQRNSGYGELEGPESISIDEFDGAFEAVTEEGESLIEPEEDFTGISWSDPQYLAVNNVPHLQHYNIINYFSFSPFYDRKCINSQLHQAQLNPEQQQDALQSWKGKQYALDGAQEPRLWAIIRNVREGLERDQYKSTGMFYIIDLNVFQSPTLLSVIQSRLMSSIFHVQSAFDILSSFTEYDPIHNYTWNRKKSEKNTLAPDDLEDLKNSGRSDMQHMSHLVSSFSKRIPQTLSAKRTAPPPEQQQAKRQKKIKN